MSDKSVAGTSTDSVGDAGWWATSREAEALTCMGCCFTASGLHFILLSLLFLDLLILLCGLDLLATPAAPAGLVGQNRETDSPAEDFLTFQQASERRAPAS